MSTSFHEDELADALPDFDIVVTLSVDRFAVRCATRSAEMSATRWPPLTRTASP
ncbi:hypothetical protein ACIRU3_04810 [Streptomyces sp. NPDC101151]|uniref:hypothetical protein n=1 Tax=Streptomyces sp. NPDC101151 TaxID=3366115 RepID=UPI00381BBE26